MAFFNPTKTTKPLTNPEAMCTIPQSEPIMITDERRPCWARGRKALFHRWMNSAHPVLPRGVEPGDKDARFFQFRSTTAIVEYEDGTVGRVYPNEVEFADGGGFDNFTWLPQITEEAQDRGRD